MRVGGRVEVGEDRWEGGNWVRVAWRFIEVGDCTVGGSVEGGLMACRWEWEGGLRACRWECGKLVKGMQVGVWKAG